MIANDVMTTNLVTVTPDDLLGHAANLVRQRSPLCITPTTSVVAAAKLLVERGLNYLPVVEYSDTEETGAQAGHPPLTYLVGLLTRSDLLLALARSLGAFEPGMELLIPLPGSNLLPLAAMLRLAAELHIAVESLIVAPAKESDPRVATVRIGTINPTPLLARLRESGIAYEFANFQPKGDTHAR